MYIKLFPKGLSRFICLCLTFPRKKKNNDEKIKTWRKSNKNQNCGTLFHCGCFGAPCIRAFFLRVSLSGTYKVDGRSLLKCRYFLVVADESDQKLATQTTTQRRNIREREQGPPVFRVALLTCWTGISAVGAVNQSVKGHITFTSPIFVCIIIQMWPIK